MLEQPAYELRRRRDEAFREYLERRVKRPRFAHGRSVRNVDRPRPPAPGEPPVRAEGSELGRDDLMTIKPDDILKSSVFAEDQSDDEGSIERCPGPIILGVVGDSAAGKTTLTRGLVRVLGEEKVTHVCTDDYHRYDRKQRAERNITPLHPDCNYMDIMAQHLAHLRAGEPILKPVYRHDDGTFGPPVYVEPKPFTVIEGLLGYYTAELRDMYDVRVYLDPPEELRRKWKVQRDCSRRGYTTDQVLAELDRREPDSEAFIRPQQQHADIVVSFLPGDAANQEHLDAELMLRDGCRIPDLAPFVGNGGRRASRWSSAGAERHMRIPGDIDRERRRAIEEAIWDADALRDATCARAARRVHDRHRAAPLGVARARPAADPVPPRDGPRSVALGGSGTRANSAVHPVAAAAPHA